MFIRIIPHPALGAEEMNEVSHSPGEVVHHPGLESVDRRLPQHGLD